MNTSYFKVETETVIGKELRRKHTYRYLLGCEFRQPNIRM